MKCCSQCESIETLFNDSVAQNELKRYLKKGPSRPTRILLDTLYAQGVQGLTLLDIGGGVGAIQHELARSGVSKITNVDASSAYLNAARQQAERQGYAGQAQFLHGNFVELADSVEAADIVTLDRVVCCYPDMPTLVSASAAKASKYYGLVFPCDRWWIKALGAVMNAIQWLRRDPFRFFVHPTQKVQMLATQHGLKPLLHRKRLFWQVLIFRRAEIN